MNQKLTLYKCLLTKDSEVYIICLENIFMGVSKAKNKVAEWLMEVKWYNSCKYIALLYLFISIDII